MNTAIQFQPRMCISTNYWTGANCKVSVGYDPAKRLWFAMHEIERPANDNDGTVEVA